MMKLYKCNITEHAVIKLSCTNYSELVYNDEWQSTKHTEHCHQRTNKIYQHTIILKHSPRQFTILRFHNLKI